ncbi:coiled-coil domain-containing protein [Jiella marina]|uniref:hypothetical protein n=1 Tax=Jiella sp. LLJ827 TaxID=2917712 RepID=UPI002100E2D6|nr:hypothetical protein [Jiella sp. LLJ827]MCQ0987193.1 hypothetical protein [Jiella sp. LLJ827]
MIATALIFIFGFLAATLIALVVAPLFWSRSRRLALREYEATIPASAREIRASLDHVRAEAAVTARRREMKAREDSEKAARARADAGRVAGENAELRSRNNVLSQTIAQTEAELKEANALLTEREGEIDRLEEELRETRLELEARSDELDVMTARFQELSEIAEERKEMIVERESRIDELSDEIRTAERERRESSHAAERLRSEVTALQAHLGKERTIVKRLEEKVTRLTSHLADRDEQIARLLGEAAKDKALGTESEADEDFAPSQFPAGQSRGAFGRRSAARPPVTSSAEVEEQVEPVAAPKPSPQEEAPQRVAELAPERDSQPPSLATKMGLTPRPDFPTDLDDAALRQRVSDLAARVIAMTAESEGPRSPLHSILEADDAAVSSGGEAATSSLLEKVRRIQGRDASRDHAAE